MTLTDKYKKIDKEYILSDSSVNEYGFRLLTEGYQLDAFQKNPIGYYMHRREDGVVLKWDNLRIADDRLMGTPVINLSHDRGLQTCDEAENGFLNAASVGHIVVLEYSTDPALMLPGQTGPTITKWYNKECSLVDIPGNCNALTQLYDAQENELNILQIHPAESGTKLKIQKEALLTPDFLAALNLADDADEATVTITLNNLVMKTKELETDNKKLLNEKYTLQQQLDELNSNHTKFEVMALLDEALENKKITVELRNKLAADYATNPVGLRSLLDAMPAYQSIVERLKATERDKAELQTMALPNVNITLANGTLGQTLQTADGVCGMVLVGVSEGTIVQGTPFTVISLDDAKTKGITQANNPIAYKEMTEFFNEAGNGATLYVLLVANTLTVDAMADQANANGAVKLLDFAAGKIRLLGIMDDPSSYTPTITNGLNENVATAKTNMQTLATTYFNKQWPFRAVIAGENYGGTATALTDQTSAAQNRVAILIGDTVTATNRAAIGLLLGRLSVIPVQRKISRVRTGPLTTSTAFIVSTDAAQYTTTATIHDKGYISFRTFPNKSGYYFTGDPTCTATTDDYCFVARGRVIDKAQILTYATYVEEIDNEVLINTDGTLNAGYCKFMEQQITNQLNLVMKANNEISSATCFVDPAQNVLATSKVTVVLKIIPVGYSSAIDVTLGFSNPTA